jgi:hypothetical protein
MHRAGPRGAGPQWRIKALERPRPLQNARFQLEVLAGAISWGFKSPSPHHRFQKSYRSLAGPYPASDFVFGPYVAPGRSDRTSFLPVFF